MNLHELINCIKYSNILYETVAKIKKFLKITKYNNNIGDKKFHIFIKYCK